MRELIMPVVLAIIVIGGILVIYFQIKSLKKRNEWIKSLQKGDLVLYGKKQTAVISFDSGMYFRESHIKEERDTDPVLFSRRTVLLECHKYRYVSIGCIDPIKK